MSEMQIKGKKIVPWKDTILLTAEVQYGSETYQIHIHGLDTRPGEGVLKIENDSGYVRLRGIDMNMRLENLGDLIRYGIKKGKQAGIF